jgi:hypothetical protein
MGGCLSGGAPKSILGPPPPAKGGLRGGTNNTSSSSNGVTFTIDLAGDDADYRRRFVEDKVLGEGEFGVVKMVRDTTTEQVAACKTLRKGAVFKNKYVVRVNAKSFFERLCFTLLCQICMLCGTVFYILPSSRRYYGAKSKYFKPWRENRIALLSSVFSRHPSLYTW